MPDDSDRKDVDSDRKDLVGPVTMAVGSLMFKGVIQAIAGWIGLELFKRFWRWLSNKFKRGGNGEGSSEGIPN